MRNLKRFFAREGGFAMLTVVCMVSLLTVLAVVLVDQVTAESNRATESRRTPFIRQPKQALTTTSPSCSTILSTTTTMSPTAKRRGRRARPTL
jgi:hypothetical protein